MELVQEACLVGVFLTSFINSTKYPSVKFSWNDILKHNRKFKNDYNTDDAAILLQLSLMVSESNYNKHKLNPPSCFKHVELTYDKCPLPIIKDTSPEPTALGHILYHSQLNIIYIIFSGTTDSCMLGMDMSHGQTDMDGLNNVVNGMKCHHGIYLAYMSIRDQMKKCLQPLLAAIKSKQTQYENKRDIVYNKYPQIVITGHSLGGALSQLCALELAYYNPIHYSFASPLIFNHTTATVFDKFVKMSYRIANTSDLITMAPFPIMPNGDIFCHVGKHLPFQRHLGDNSLNHTLAYVYEYQLSFSIKQQTNLHHQ